MRRKFSMDNDIMAKETELIPSREDCPWLKSQNKNKFINQYSRKVECISTIDDRWKKFIHQNKGKEYNEQYNN